MLRAAIALCAAAALLSAPAYAQSGPNSFTFVALGDMPYRSEDVVKVDRLIAAINRLKPAFSIHVGDIKPGRSSCENAALEAAFAQINKLEQPVVYTIGDNEWTDCGREEAGKFDPSGRLTKVRELAFSNPGRSLGKRTMRVVSQAKAMPEFAGFVENQRFSRHGVVFIIAHIVGSENGLDRREPDAQSEFAERNAANIAWIEDGFRVAAQTQAKAVVIAFHANPYVPHKDQGSGKIAPGFVDTITAIATGAKAFGKPVLVVQGDKHVLEIEKFKDTSLDPIPNVLRLQVFGDTLVHAVRIRVDPDMPGVFSFLPLIVPKNGSF